MRMPIVRRRHLLLAVPALAAAPRPATAQPATAHHAPEIRAGDLVLSAPWSRAAAQGGSGAGFLTIRNAGTVPDRLLSATTAAAGRVELHTHIRDGDVMRMRPVPVIELPPGEAVTLRPGGLHLMLLGLIRPLRQGEVVPVTLTFERAGVVEASLAVQAAGARAPAHAH